MERPTAARNGAPAGCEVVRLTLDGGCQPRCASSVAFSCTPCIFDMKMRLPMLLSVVGQRDRTTEPTVQRNIQTPKLTYTSALPHRISLPFPRLSEEWIEYAQPSIRVTKSTTRSSGFRRASPGCRGLPRDETCRAKDSHQNRKVDLGRVRLFHLRLGLNGSGCSAISRLVTIGGP